MKKCPRCGNGYPDPFGFCPVDGEKLSATPGEADYAAPLEQETSVSVRLLVRGLLILVLVGLISFSAVFLYYYLKPKYGGLVVKTTPPGATIYVDGKQRGVSPLTIADLKSGGHKLRAVK